MTRINYEDTINDTSYELAGIHSIMGGLYERYLERSYHVGLNGEELREFISAYGFCMDLINRKRRELDALFDEAQEVAR